MTSFAFILGIWPLVNATGAGAASRRSLGTAVFGGMIAATVLAVFFVPVFYVLMQRIGEFRRRPQPAGREPSVHGIGKADVLSADSAWGADLPAVANGPNVTSGGEAAATAGSLAVPHIRDGDGTRVPAPTH